VLLRGPHDVVVDEAVVAEEGKLFRGERKGWEAYRKTMHVEHFLPREPPRGGVSTASSILLQGKGNKATHLVLHVAEKTTNKGSQVDDMGRLVLLEERKGLREVPVGERRKMKVSTAIEERERGLAPKRSRRFDPLRYLATTVKSL
jgi:hypothetical protein